MLISVRKRVGLESRKGLRDPPAQQLNELISEWFTMHLKAFLTSTGLSILFLVVYGGCNWISSQRTDVSTFYFQWERAIPFVPFLILPYLSIDLFFIAAPFLCRTDRELRVFSQRIIAAIVVAGMCFLIFPLRFAFPRPQANGWVGAVFDWFRGMDAPYNLVPSLHAAFWMFLLQVYIRHTRGFLRGAAIIWMMLIGLSPLLTYQHHIIDIITGFALAAYCFYFFREGSEKLPVIANCRIGLYYFAGALLVLTLAMISRPWGALLLWPSVALTTVGIGYFGVGPVIFRKRDGQLPWSSRFVLGPYLLGQYLSLLHYRRQCRRWDEIRPSLWIGRKLNNREAATAIDSGVTAVLDLCAEFSETKPFRAITYRNIPILDLSAPNSEQLAEMGAFITEQSKYGIVYVHCKIGYSRSAAAVAAYLLISGQVSVVTEAVSAVRRARPAIVIRSEVITALYQFEADLGHESSGAEAFLLASAESETY